MMLGRRSERKRLAVAPAVVAGLGGFGVVPDGPGAGAWPLVDRGPVLHGAEGYAPECGELGSGEPGQHAAMISPASESVQRRAVKRRSRTEDWRCWCSLVGD